MSTPPAAASSPRSSSPTCPGPSGSRHGMSMELSNLPLQDMREVVERFAAQAPDRTPDPTARAGFSHA
jgi:hypothetical protein